MTRRILVIDENPLTSLQLEAVFAEQNYALVPVGLSRDALELLRHQEFDLLITDWNRDDLETADLLTSIRAENIPVGALILAGAGDPLTAVEAMKAGADDFITKPVDPQRLGFTVQKILERRALLDELETLRNRMRTGYGFCQLVSKCPKMKQAFDIIEQVSPLTSTVLIQGETGTGKDLVAQAIHQVGGRRGPLVALNCAALQDSLLESELFGHEKGAFTGAERQRMGRFEQANHGTLFLDEIGDISPAMQVRLLRVLQSGQFERVGGNETIQVDVRIVAASNKKLEDEVRAGRFRNDLFFRVSVVRIELPPLRERKEDIPLLTAHFLEKLKHKSTPPVTDIHPQAMRSLMDHSWPGNVRELENAIKAAVAMADGTIIHREALPASVAPRSQRPQGSDSPLIDLSRPLPELTDNLVAQVEREYFAQLLAMYRGNIARCAKHSGLSRRSVSQKLLKYSLDREEFRIRAV